MTNSDTTYVTIFTPAYNRAYILPCLYASLCRQSCLDFEWLIVDDGSNDDTESIVQAWIAENRIRIRYIRQNNGGKHRAINKGLSEASGKLFMIVDSDDYLTDDAIEWMCREGKKIEDIADLCGLSGIRITPSGAKIGGGSVFEKINASAIDIRLKHGIKGDLAEIFKTDILKKYPFPEFEGEKFCPEALVWFRMARKYKMSFFHKGIYICEYLPDGLTAKITRIRRESPRASMTFYAEHFHDAIPLKWKIKAAINFWRFALAPYQRSYDMLSPLSLLCFIPGKLMSLRDSIS